MNCARISLTVFLWGFLTTLHMTPGFNLIIMLKSCQPKVWEFFRRRSRRGKAHADAHVKCRDIYSGTGVGGGYPHMVLVTYVIKRWYICHMYMYLSKLCQVSVCYLLSVSLYRLRYNTFIYTTLTIAPQNTRPDVSSIADIVYLFIYLLVVSRINLLLPYVYLVLLSRIYHRPRRTHSPITSCDV